MPPPPPHVLHPQGETVSLQLARLSGQGFATSMSGGLVGLTGRGVASTIPDCRWEMTGPVPGLLQSILLEAERQKLQLLRQLTFLSASSQAIESITSLQHQQHRSQQLYQARGAIDRQELSDAATFERVASRSLGAMPQSRSSLLESVHSGVRSEAAAKAVVSGGSTCVRQAEALQALPPGGCRSPAKRVGRSSVFPKVLHAILADLERQGREDIASFLPHGRAFAIHKPREFAANVLPRYFRMGHFTSFQRQLNLYDFQRVTRGEDKVRGGEGRSFCRGNLCQPWKLAAHFSALTDTAPYSLRCTD
jgi:HSF-type DNA-binding